MYADDDIYVGDTGIMYDDEYDGSYQAFDFDQEVLMDELDEHENFQKCFAPEVMDAQLDYMTTRDLDIDEYREWKAENMDSTLITTKKLEFEDCARTYYTKAVKIPRGMDKRVLAANWENYYSTFELRGNSKNSLLVMQEKEYAHFQNKIMDNYWSFEEDFRIMFCHFFYNDPLLALPSLNRNEIEVQFRCDTLNNCAKFQFLDKAFSLWPSEYLQLLKTLPLHHDDEEVIRNMPSDRLLSPGEMRHLKRRLVLPMDTEMVMFYWQKFFDDNLLFDQMVRYPTLHRIPTYIEDDVEETEDPDFTRTHRYLYNAIPGISNVEENLLKEPIMNCCVASDPVVILDFPKHVDQYFLKKDKLLLNFSGIFEVIPLILEDRVYRPSRPYSIAIMLFIKKRRLFILNLCYFPITVGVEFVPSKSIVQVSTKCWTSVCLMPTQTEKAEIILKPNFFYFNQAVKPVHLPAMDRMIFEFSRFNVAVGNPRNIKSGYKEAERIRCYRGLMNRFKNTNELKNNEDDAQFLRDYQRTYLIKKNEILKKNKAPTDTEVITDLLNDMVESVDTSLKGGVWKKEKISTGPFPMKSKIIYMDTKPTPNVKILDKTKVDLYKKLRKRNYRMRNFTGYHPVDYLYSRLMAHKQDKKKLRVDARNLNQRTKPKVIPKIPNPGRVPIMKNPIVKKVLPRIVAVVPRIIPAPKRNPSAVFKPAQFRPILPPAATHGQASTNGVKVIGPKPKPMLVIVDRSKKPKRPPTEKAKAKKALTDNEKIARRVANAAARVARKALNEDVKKPKQPRNPKPK